MRGEDPVVDGVDASAYRVPTPSPEADGTLSWEATTLVVAEVTPARSPDWATPTPTPRAFP
ncbi:hypothetical protein GCM10027445_20110 [Amycolatopsis endophytica]